jgi:uncharacterized membrane protein
MSHSAPMVEAPLPRGPRFAIALTTLALVGFSLVSLAWQLSMESSLRSRFLLDNELGIPLRGQLLATLALGALLPVLLAGIVRIRRGPDFEPRLHRFAALVAPLGLLFWLPVLFEWQGAQKNALMYLVMLSVFVFAMRAIVTRALEALHDGRGEHDVLTRPRFRLPSWLAFSIVLLAGAAYTAYTSYFTILNHRQVGTMAFDLGIYDNLMYNAMHGRFFHSPVLFGPGDRNYIAGHAELAMLLFVPFYALRPNAETLLIIQSVVLGMAVLPLFMFARRLIPTLGAVLLSLAYLLFAPLHGPHFYDFHWLPLAIFFHFWLYYAIVSRKTWLVVLSVLVLFAVREDVPVGLALLGVFLFVTGLRMRLGVILAVVSTVWFGIDKFVLMPRMGAWWFENIYSELFADGRASYSSVISTLITNPVYAVSSFVRAPKLSYGLHMVAPLAFLPLRRVAFLLLLIPGAAFTLMTTAYWPTTEISFQYTTHWIPYLFLACVLGLTLMRYEKAGASKRGAALLALSVGILSHSYNFGAVLQRESFRGGFSKISFEMSPEAKKQYEDLTSLLRLIPRDASVAATEALNPHISSRLDAYTLRYDFGPVDYMLLNRREIAGDPRNVLIEALNRYSYRLVKRAGDLYLLKRGSQNAATEAALRELGLPSSKRQH